MSAADEPLAQYFGNSVLCRDESTGAVCHFWLNADRTYFLMYDRGAQKQAPTVGGDFRLEGRQGRYTVQQDGTGAKVCLQPESVPDKQFAIEADKELFAGAACYVLATDKHAGDSWEQTDQGRTYKLWLVRGHG